MLASTSAPALRFPGFTEPWQRMAVADLLEFYSTNSLSWEQLSNDAESEFKNLHYGLIHVGLPTIVNIGKDTLPYIKDDAIPRNYVLCENGDISFADASEDTSEVAKAIEFTGIGNEKVVSGLHTIHGRDKRKQTIVGFKGYLFSSEAFHKQTRRIAQGSKVFSISTKNFSEIFVSIPSKDEQRKIAEMLLLVDERIATQRRLIEDFTSLRRAILQDAIKRGLSKKSWKLTTLNDILTERGERNSEGYDICSVSVSEGVVNQIEYLGRSFAAKETGHYNVARYGDIIYTKSPTGSFPYGIVKRDTQKEPAAISPLYGVFVPKEDWIGILLGYYFESEVNTFNYLHPIIQKGAKNTINITNIGFLANSVPLPTDEREALTLAKCLDTISGKIVLEKSILIHYTEQREYLLSKMFV